VGAVWVEFAYALVGGDGAVFEGCWEVVGEFFGGYLRMRTMRGDFGVGELGLLLAFLELGQMIGVFGWGL